MSINGTIYACLGIGLSSALVAGTFQAFSEFIMKALVEAQPAGGIETMQLINRKVYKTVFLTLLLGLMPLTLGFAVYSYLNIIGSPKTWIICGAFIYLVFVFLVTMLGNVPMNTRLDGMNYLAADTATYWENYGRVWTNWNHIRTLGSIATSVCFLIAAVSFS